MWLLTLVQGARQIAGLIPPWLQAWELGGANVPESG